MHVHDGLVQWEQLNTEALPGSGHNVLEMPKGWMLVMKPAVDFLQCSELQTDVRAGESSMSKALPSLVKRSPANPDWAPQQPVKALP